MLLQNFTITLQSSTYKTLHYNQTTIIYLQNFAQLAIFSPFFKKHLCLIHIFGYLNIILFILSWLRVTLY